MSSPHSLRSFCSALFMTLVCALPALAQTATIRGRVEDATTRSPVVGALVFLSGRGSILTDRNGAFQFSGVPNAAHELRVQALGYQTSQVRVDLRADTALTIALNPSPVQIDSLRVTARRVNVGGRLLDEVINKQVMEGS